jgi:hypothetical protein
VIGVVIGVVGGDGSIFLQGKDARVKNSQDSGIAIDIGVVRE